jgi:hypothetical protein
MAIDSSGLISVNYNSIHILYTLHIIYFIFNNNITEKMYKHRQFTAILLVPVSLLLFTHLPISLNFLVQSVFFLLSFFLFLYLHINFPLLSPPLLTSGPFLSMYRFVKVQYISRSGHLNRKSAKTSYRRVIPCRST